MFLEIVADPGGFNEPLSRQIGSATWPSANARGKNPRKGIALLSTVHCPVIATYLGLSRDACKKYLMSRMSGPCPIPHPFMAQFVAHMRQCDAHQLAPADWLGELEEGAEAFMARNAMMGRARDAVLQYIDWKSSSAGRNFA